MLADAQLLVADDDPDVLKAAEVTLARAGARVAAATGPEDLARFAEGQAYDAILLDMNFAPAARGGDEGLALLDRLRAADPARSVVLMTTWGGVALAVEGLRRGAVNFVLKPWRNQALVEVMDEAVELTRRHRRDDAAFNLDDLERRAIERALSVYDGNVSHAATALGLTRPALYRRMARHGL
ncbi:MAG TPA: response regulator [Caulobacteraceae bacterium]|jgi:DNA-binding NtrC family response regulator